MHFELAGKKARAAWQSQSRSLLLFFVAVNRGLYLDPELEIEYGRLLLVLSMLGGVAAGLLIAVKPGVDEKHKKLVNTVMFLIMPIFSMQMVECFNGNFVWNFSVKTGIANYMIYLVFYLICYLITGKYHLTGLIINIFLYVWSLINYFVELFRGTPFVPMDILSVKTGLECFGRLHLFSELEYYSGDDRISDGLSV